MLDADTGGRPLDLLLQCCVESARAAADHAVAQKRRRHEVHQRFTHDVKLALDLECQAVATSVIHRHFPGDTILGEEGSHAGGEGIEWVVDPIDGTVNFFHGVPWWCSSVAVRLGERVLAGAVYAPEQGMLFEASCSTPTRLNGAPVRASTVETLADSLVITGSEKELTPGKLPLATAQMMAPHVQKVRILGAAAIDICQIASGSAELFYQAGLYIWDVAAAGLIVQQAGGIFRRKATDHEGRYICLACGNPALAAAFDRQFPDG